MEPFNTITPHDVSDDEEKSLLNRPEKEQKEVIKRLITAANNFANNARSVGNVRNIFLFSAGSALVVGSTIDMLIDGQVTLESFSNLAKQAFVLLAAAGLSQAIRSYYNSKVNEYKEILGLIKK